MGGKEKQAHRTKGNVKPSSSARAAELLANAGGNSLGFVGFGSMSGDLGYVPAASGGDDVDNSIDAQFRLVLRKMSKRDATTKLKALQELGVLCKEKDLDSIKSILPFWPRIYNKMAIDHDRRVREASQQAFEQLIIRVCRNLAPHLKGLMGTWLVAQSDPYAPAASAAKAAFLRAFPPAKQSEAVVFCKEEVLNHLYENLLIHTAQSLSDPKTTEPEDLQAKYYRVVCASLTALKTFMATVPLEQQCSLQDKYRSILSDGKFWKLGKHKQQMIVGSFYSVISGFCQYHPSIAKEYSDKVSPAVLYNLDNTEPLICPTLWEATLYTVSTLEDCWKHVNARKGVVPRLWSLLKQGSSGNATVIYPNLLPFLNHVPTEVLGDGIGFYNEFFSNLKIGLTQPTAIQSVAECNAIVSAFMECLQHILSRNLDNQQLAECLVGQHLVSLLGSTLLEEGHTSSTSMFSMTVDLLIFLHRATSKDSENRESASAILKQIVVSIKELNIIEIGSDKVLARYSMFLQSFKQSDKSSKMKMKGSKVMFADDKSTTVISEKVENFYKPLVEANGLLHPVICDACRAAYKKSLTDKSLGNLVFFSQVFKMFASESLAEKVWDQSDTLVILKDCVSPWMAMLDSDITKEKPKMYQAFVEVLLTLSKIGTMEEKAKLLSSALESVPIMAVFQKFAQAVFAQNSDELVRNWFKGPKFGERIVAVTRDLCTQSCGNMADDFELGGDTDIQWDLLSLAFTVDDKSGEPLLGEVYMTQVLQEILDSLPSPAKLRSLPQGQISHCVAFVCDVATNFFSNVKGCLLLPPAEELLFALFQISCQQTLQSESVVQKVEKTWHQGVTSLFLQSELSQAGINITEETQCLGQQQFFKKAASYIKGLVCSEANTFDRLDRLVTVSRSLISSVQSCVYQSETGPFAAESKQEDSQHDLRRPQTTVNQMVQELYQDLFIPFLHDELPKWNVGTLVSHDLPSMCMDSKIVDFSPPSVSPKCVMTITFTSQLMADKLREDVATSRPVLVDSSSENETERIPGDVDDGLVLDMWYGLAVCETIVKSRAKAYASTEFGRVHKMLENNIAYLSKNIPAVVRTKVITSAWERSMSEGGLWSLCLEAIIKSMDRASILEFVRSIGGPDRLQSLKNHALETLYVLLPHMSASDTRQLAEIHAALLLTSELDDLVLLSGNLSVVSRFLALQNPIATSEQEPEGYDFDPEVMLCVLDQIQTWKDTKNELFLFDSLVKSADWDVVTFNTEVLCFLHAVITTMPTKLPEKSWDFILCSLVEWVQSCNESKQVLTSDPKTAMFAIATLKLLTSTANCMKVFNSTTSGGLPPNLCTEWKEFFSAGTYNLVVPLFVFIAEKSASRKLNTGHELLVQSLATAVGLCPVDHIKNHQLPAKLIAGDSSSLPVEQQTALNHLCPLLLSPNRAIQLGAHRLLATLLPELAPDEDQDTSDALEEKQPRSPPNALMRVLDTAYEGAHLLLGDISMDEPIVLESHGDEYTVTMGYLLSWNLVLAYVRNAKVELRAEYAYYLRDHDKMNMLMPCLIKLMPSSPLVPQVSTSLDDKPPGTKNLFEEEPQLSVEEEAVGEEVRHMACYVYSHVVQDLPAVLRQWYNDQDKRVSALMNRYTSKYVSPLMCSKEMAAIQQSDRVLDNMTIKTRSAAREVVATYSLEEISIELVITLPTNHPLGPMTIECGKRIGVANTQWRTWMLQLTTFLHKQNGSIVDGLSLWKRNVDKRFEGVEECMICFSVIHGSNFQLPKLQCKTCKKRFHSACLYKWFSTSNNSSCPLCRNLF